MLIDQHVVYSEDILKQLVKLSTDNKKSRYMKIAINVLGAAYILWGGLIIHDSASFAGWFLVIIGLLLMVYVNYLFSRSLYKKALKQNEKMLGMNTHYVISDEGIHIDSDISTNDYTWAATSRIAEMSTHLAIVLSNNTSVTLNKSELSEEQISWLYSKVPAKY